MTDRMTKSENSRPEEADVQAGKRIYQRPALQKLGTLRDLTANNSFGGPDGMPHRGTGRGGDC